MQRPKTDLNIKASHISPLLSVLSFTKYWLKTKAVSTFPFLVYLPHGTPCHGWAGAPIPESTLPFWLEIIHILFDLQKTCGLTGGHAKVCPGKARAVGGLSPWGLLYRAIRSSGWKVAEVIQAFQSFPAKKIEGGFKMGSIFNPCPRVPVCLNLWGLCQG